MNTIEAIESRRAVKHYDPEHRLSAAQEHKLLQLALLSPTSFNIQNWRFVVVKDPQLREQIRAIAWDQAQVTDASLFVVLCADLKAWTTRPERYFRDTEPDVRAWLTSSLHDYFQGREQLQRDEAMRSCGIAAQTLMLAAKAMGYDSCPMGGFDFEAMGRLLHLPADHVVGLAVAIGKPLSPARPRMGQLALEEVVIQDRFQ